MLPLRMVMLVRPRPEHTTNPDEWQPRQYLSVYTEVRIASDRHQVTVIL